MNKATLILGTLLLASAAGAAEMYGSNPEINRMKPEDQAILVSMAPDKTMQASMIKIPHITGGKSLLCFKDPDKQQVGCFMLNLGTGEVLFVALPSNETSV